MMFVKHSSRASGAGCGTVNTRGLHPFERSAPQVAQQWRVDPDCAGTDRFLELQAELHVFRSGVSHQSVLGIVGDGDRFFGLIENLDGGEGAKHFFLADPQAVVPDPCNGRLHEVTRRQPFQALAARQDFRTL